jgi:ABC-type sugar transport system permease subunit
MQSTTTTTVQVQASVSARLNRRKGKVKEYLFGYLLILPTFALTFLFTDIPLLRTMYDSFFQGSLLGGLKGYVGLHNYTASLQSGGAMSLFVTLKFTIGFVVLATLLGLIIGLLLNKPIKGISLFRTAFIVPLVVPIVATGFIWVTLFNPFFGIVDRILAAVGLPRVDWFNDPHAALVTVILFSTWQHFGQNVILFLAALKGLPKDLLEAAEIDGAGPFKRVKSIVLPMLVPSIALIVVLTTIAALQVFTQIYVLTGGGPVGSTTTAAFYIYSQAFTLYNTGTADALATILFIITIAITILQMRVLRRFGAEGHEASNA